MAEPKLSVVVTGANSGIGRAMSKALLLAGHDVAMVCRNKAKAEQARSEISQGASGNATLFLADLSSPDAIRRVSEELCGLEAVDVLINNAGLHMNQRTENSAGTEMMFMVNHLAPFMLTMLLRRKLTTSSHGRVVTVASLGHRMARVKWDDLEAKKGHVPIIQYANTKLMNIWFTKELHRRARGQLTATCFHPGVVSTEFAQDDRGFLNGLMRIGKPFLRSADKAARTGVFLATDATAANGGGGYFANSKARPPSRTASDPALALRLWRRTVAITSLDYD